MNRPAFVPRLAGQSILPPNSPDGLPPFDAEAEVSLLAHLVYEQQSIPAVRAILAPEDMWEDKHIRLYRAICEYSDAGTEIDFVTLKDVLIDREGMPDKEYIALAGDIQHAREEHTSAAIYARRTKEEATAAAELYARRLHAMSVKRKLIEHHTEQLRLLYARDYEVDTILDHAKSEFGRIESSADVSDKPIELANDWPLPPSAPAWRGVTGDLALAIAPHTEADPAAILIQLIVAFGNLLGRKAHWKVGGTKHYTNLFACIVGRSSKARKGSGWDLVRFVLEMVDGDWARTRIQDGLQSGHGLIGAVRDDRSEAGQIIQGVSDKRILILEEEFASILAPMGCSANPTGKQMCGIIRKFWSGGDAQLLKLHNQVKATNAHVSMVGHISFDELRQCLSKVDTVNGFANRFLWCCARRSGFLPNGGKFHEVDLMPFIIRMKEIAHFCECLTSRDVYELDDEANEFWDPVYRDISDPPPGDAGNILGRAEAQTKRLAMFFAIQERDFSIRVRHLESALAMWHYCEDSVYNIWGLAEDAKAHQAVLTAMREAGATMSRTEISRAAFGGHVNRDALTGILSGLLSERRISQAEEVRAGRKTIVYGVL